ncbi:MAG TPA: ribonuclease III family protein [Candidatus Bathyarchaeia archaeon]|nr:ribonuclease III family protein [Candidatus Bathyarchaeia archaeon]
MCSIKHGERFLKNYASLSQVLTDEPLAALGDAYVNFVYSLALSKRTGKPRGKKVKGAPLAGAVRKAGLRQSLPTRIDKHNISDAAEGLLVYAWLNNCFTLEESVEVLEKTDDLEEGLTRLLLIAKEKVRL